METFRSRGRGASRGRSSARAPRRLSHPWTPSRPLRAPTACQNNEPAKNLQNNSEKICEFANFPNAPAGQSDVGQQGKRRVASSRRFKGEMLNIPCDKEVGSGPLAKFFYDEISVLPLIFHRRQSADPFSSREGCQTTN